MSMILFSSTETSGSTTTTAKARCYDRDVSTQIWSVVTK